MRRFSAVSLILALVVPILFLWNDASAVPAFARKYHTACSTCHLAFPVRNGFGEAFRNNGYRFPDSTDEEMVKEEPIKLGQDSYKKIFPKAIWPSDLPNMPTLGFLARVGASTFKENGKFSNSRLDEELDIFFAGTVTNQISYIGDFAVGPNGEPATLGRITLLWTFKPGITMAFGTVGFPERFDIISTTAGPDDNGFAAQMPNPNKGVELRLAGAAGKNNSYFVVAGLGRNTQSDGAPVFTDGTGVATTYDANGSVNGGNFGDTKFVRATFKIGGNGLLNGSGGVLGNQVIGMDQAITIGFNYLNSSDGANAGFAEYLPGLSHTVYGGDIMATYGNARAIVQYTRFSEILDNTGVDTGKRNALSVEGDYWIYPWLFGVVRYEHMKDSLNGEYTRLIPGIGALLRPNFKVGVEYVNVSKLDNWTDPFYSPTNSWKLFTQLGF